MNYQAQMCIHIDQNLLLLVESSPPSVHILKCPQTRTPRLACCHHCDCHTYTNTHQSVHSEFVVCTSISHLIGAICACAFGYRIFSPDWPSFRRNSHPQVLACVFVPVALLAAVDWCCCHPQDCSHLQGLPLYTPFLPFSILHPFLSCNPVLVSIIHDPVFTLSFTLSLCNLLFSLPLCPHPLSSFPSFRVVPVSHSILNWAVSLFALWPCCNSAREVTADRFLWKGHCHVW